MIPSAAGVGLAWTFHWYYGAAVLPRRRDRLVGCEEASEGSEEFTFPVASGMIAGESLMGVALVFWENGPELVRRLFGH